MKKGFTLVELLAVVVIISLLTLITVTSVTSIVTSGKHKLNKNQILLLEKSAQLWGADNLESLPNNNECSYITLNDLIDKGYVKDELQDLETNEDIDTSEIKIRIDATINSNGKLIYKYDINPTDLDDCGYIYEKPKYTITFDTMGGTEIASVRVREGETIPLPKNPQKHEYKFREWMLDNTVYDFDTPVTGDMTLIAAYDLTDQYTMMTGQNFNKAVKTLVKGSTVSSYSTSDNTVEHIEFYSNGELPSEFTLSQLQALPSTIVSLTGETIKAYYDSTSKSIYVYSSGEIVWNSNSTYIFSNFKKMNTFEIPYNITSIVTSAFYNCSGLTSIIIPNSVTSIGTSAFYNCSGLTSITIPNSVTSIGSSAFYGASLTSITIPSSVTSIGNNVFANCKNLTSIMVDPNNQIFEDRNSNAIIKKSNNELIVGCKNTIIPNSVTSIGSSAFYGTSLTSITIPSSVTSIGSNAFYNCSGLTSITIPNSVTSIGSSAFYGASLTSITIPSSVTSIGSSAFARCKNLTSIMVDPNNQIFEDRNSNAIIKKSNNELIVSCKNTIIPNSVTSIGAYAFYGTSLTSITIPSSVTSIGSFAFANSSNLTSITIPSSVTYISNNVFYGCSKLTAISFELPTGWWYADSASATSGTSIDLSNANQNATYFENTYMAKHWKNGS